MTTWDRARCLVERFGSPVYVYDLPVVARQLEALRRFLPRGARVLYSLKANPHPVVCRLLVHAGCGLEVSSLGELRVALEAGAASADVVFTGPAKTARDIAEALERGVDCFSCESSRELRLLNVESRRLDAKVRVLLRISPFANAKAALRMAGSDSHFGFRPDEVSEELLKVAGDVEVVGLHFYQGTQLQGPEALEGAFAAAAEVAHALSHRLRTTFQVVDLGGGFPWQFGRRGDEPDLNVLEPKLEALTSKLGGSVWFESGRFLSAACGTLVGRVVSVREREGSIQVITDVGINALGGMTGLRRVASSHVVPEFELEASVAPCSVDVYGPLCTPLDRMATGISVAARPKEGDLFLVPNVGAYGLTASLLGFLSHQIPREVAIDADGTTWASNSSLRRTALQKEEAL
jgi:diaminopimelate decarboxylase